MLHSRLYSGSVRHRRITPAKHGFNYRLYMLFLDLDELPSIANQAWYFSVDKVNLINFRSRDYLDGNAASPTQLKQGVINRVEQWFAAQRKPCPEICRVALLTHPRYLGIVFNPLSMYYCYNGDNELVAMLADVSNTPWNERHHYVLPVSEDTFTGVRTDIAQEQMQFQCQKQFHVSPFNPMQMDYHWRIRRPQQQLFLHIENHLRGEEAEKHFDATVAMEAQPISKLGRFALKQPVMTLQVVWGIYWQALKLFFKKVPIYDHPKT